MDFVALKAELTTDPTGLGYAPHWASGNDAALADMLNLVRTGLTIFKGTVSGREVMACIDPGEFLGLQAAQRDYVAAITGADGGVDTSSATVRAAFGAIFTQQASPISRAALLAFAQRDGSRAEKLWGAGVAVSPYEVSQARRA